ncbi:MAG: selenium cofactor biosynthesis protein YqeC [Thermodesulfobacteriota bacterium]
MTRSVHTLAEALGFGEREHLALVGAGGKTSLLLALAGELQRAGKGVLASTTTKMWQHEAAQLGGILFLGSAPAWREDLRKGLQEKGIVFLAEGSLDSGKVQGVGSEVLDELFREEDVDCLVVEADGSAGHPVKAPAGHEPVIPGTATGVVALMGLEALGRPAGPETVFRMEAFQRVTGIRPGEPLSPAALAGLFGHAEGVFKGAPAQSRRIVFLNKRDLVPGDEGAVALADHILGHDHPRVERVVIGSLRDKVYKIVKLAGMAKTAKTVKRQSR